MGSGANDQARCVTQNPLDPPFAMPRYLFFLLATEALKGVLSYNNLNDLVGSSYYDVVYITTPKDPNDPRDTEDTEDEVKRILINFSKVGLGSDKSEEIRLYAQV